VLAETALSSGCAVPAAEVPASSLQEPGRQREVALKAWEGKSLLGKVHSY
jgi:hypothetical protein